MRSCIRAFIPQWLAVVVCTLARHPMKRYSQFVGGRYISVETCRCGRRQSVQVGAGNRRIRRRAARVLKRRT